MKHILTASAALLLLAGTAAMAQDNDHHDNHMPGAMTGPAMHGPAMAGPGMHGPMVHSDWHNGGNVPQADWGRGQKIDYREHHLKRPPHGYEWRQVDGNYILAAAATGLIASILVAH
jgi:Ni/Co efflux regulator RcnB